jgi:ATP-dependent protease HslVU (ClpYQ) peptidase subunit
MELLEKEFEKYPGQTLRACLSLAKQWRTSKFDSPNHVLKTKYTHSFLLT